MWSFNSVGSSHLLWADILIALHRVFSVCLPVCLSDLYLSFSLAFLSTIKDRRWSNRKSSVSCPQTVQTFAHNSILLTDLEFNYREKDFICPWHWLLIYCNAIRNCICKWLYCPASEKMMWSSRYEHSVEIGQQAYSFYSFVDILSCRLSDQCYRSNDTNVVFVGLILLCYFSRNMQSCNVDMCVLLKF